MKLTKWIGSLPQILWFAGLPKREQNRICAALATRRFRLRWNAERREGVLVPVR